MALVKQIPSIVNDAVKDALGKVNGVTKIETTDIVSMGKALDDYDLYDDFYHALTRRIIAYRYFIRPYQSKQRSILRDEHEYGAFVSKVYYKSPEAVENPTYDVAQGTSPETYKQTSPYDVETVVEVESKIFGGQGTWSMEFIRPLQQIKDAFTNPSEMDAFISGMMLAVDNKFKEQEDAVVNLADSTAIASAIFGGNARNLLQEYNLAHPTATLTLAQCLESADFLKFASKEINETIDHMGNMSTVFNVGGYETYTSKENLVVEMLSQFASATDMYLQADTFHNELTKLPNFEKVNFWQSSGKTYAFADCSKINIAHDDFITTKDPTGTIAQGGVICFLHDTENVAAYFGDRREWEEINNRSEVAIHGIKARKGFAIDNYANAYVFYLEYIEPENSEEQ